MPVQAKGHVRPEKSAYHSIALLTESFEKDISLLVPRACSTMDKIVDRCALTIYPYSLGRQMVFTRAVYPCPMESQESLGRSSRLPRQAHQRILAHQPNNQGLKQCFLDNDGKFLSLSIFHHLAGS